MARKKVKTEKPPAIDKLMWPAVGVALAFLGYYFIKGVANEIPRLDVKDELVLRQVFFGEGSSPKNYVVLCHSEPEDEKSASIPISSVFADAQAESGVGPTPLAEFGLMDCTYVLPSSGKTIAQRFGLDLQKRPTIFVSGPAIEENKPKQIPSKHMKTGHMFVKLLKQMLKPHAAKINTSKELKSKCLNKDYCGLLLKGGTPETYVKDAVKNLLITYPQVQYASIDSKLLYATNLEAEYLPEFESGTHRFVLFRKVSGGMSVSSGNEEDDKKEEGRIITSILPLSEPLSFGSIKKIVDKGLKEKAGAMKKIPALPQVKTRTKKLEGVERKKRERSQNQQQKKKEQKRSTPAGQFAANDGSREGRKAERDRRRQEHQKNDPNYREKTPEEKAEIERKRRQRMEEEGKKWNVAPEDAPPEGDYFEEEGDMYMDDETYVEYEDIDDDSSTDEDDEDILDLD